MVASSVVLTVVVLNYHHRTADIHEMPTWVSVSARRKLLVWTPTYIFIGALPSWGNYRAAYFQGAWGVWKFLKTIPSKTLFSEVIVLNTLTINL